MKKCKARLQKSAINSYHRRKYFSIFQWRRKKKYSREARGLINIKVHDNNNSEYQRKVPKMAELNS